MSIFDPTDHPHRRYNPLTIGASLSSSGGFGGCSMALVESDMADEFANHIAQAYHEETGLMPNIYVCNATNGAEVVTANQ